MLKPNKATSHLVTLWDEMLLPIISVYFRRRKRLDFNWPERPLIFSPCVASEAREVSCPPPCMSSGRNSPTDLYPRMAIFRDFGCGISRSGYRIQSSGSTATSNRMASKFKGRRDSTYRPQITAGIPPLCSVYEEFYVHLLKIQCYFRSHKGSMEYLLMYNNCVTPLRDVMN